MSSILVNGTQTYLVLNNLLCLLDFRIVIEVFTFLSVFDKWKCGYCSYCRWRWLFVCRVEKHDVCV